MIEYYIFCGSENGFFENRNVNLGETGKDANY